MSSLFNHIFIPLALLMLFANMLNLNREDKVYITVLSFFGILPDMDIFMFHRASLHNIFVIIIIPLIILLVVQDVKIYMVTMFYVMSHIILDIFNGGVFLLYPFGHSVYFSRVEIWFIKGHVIPMLNYGVRDSVVNIVGIEPAISSENIGVSILIAILAVVYVILRYKGKINKGIKINKGME